MDLDGGTGDPGAYDPFTNTEIAAESSMTFNKMSKPFGSTAKRELNVNIMGGDTPGPGKYKPERPEAAADANVSVFSSGSAQRPACPPAAAAADSASQPPREGRPPAQAHSARRAILPWAVRRLWAELQRSL